MKKLLFLSILLLMVLIPTNCFALNEVNVYFFHDDDCSICEQERVYLQALQKDRYPNMRIYSYEIGTETNHNLMLQAKKLYNESRTGVPFTIVGDKVFYGFSQGVKGEFQQAVYTYSNNKYENKLGQQIGISYKTDLEGTVQEYKENSNYTVEETSGKETTPTKKKNPDISKYTNSIILVSAGIILFVIYIVLKIRERRWYR